jgi:hypothetical protein
MRDPFFENAVHWSFWIEPNKDQRRYVLPIQPDIIPGRIGQQNSCFTFHMHLAAPVENDTLITIKVSADRKSHIRDELHRVNMNQFTAYYDLDHLTGEINRSWDL